MDEAHVQDAGIEAPAAEVQTADPKVVKPKELEVAPKDVDEEISFVEDRKDVGLSLDVPDLTSVESVVVEEAEVSPEVKEPLASQLEHKKVEVQAKVEETPVAESLSEVTKVEGALMEKGPAEKAKTSRAKVRFSKPQVEGTKDAEAVQEVSVHVEDQEVPGEKVATLEVDASVVEENKEAAPVNARQRFRILSASQRFREVSATERFQALSASERLKILQISQWSLKHRILVFDMIEKNETETAKTKEKYEKACRRFVYGGATIPFSAVGKSLKDELERVRVVDQHTEWFSTFDKKGYLRQHSNDAAGVMRDDWSVEYIYEAVEKGEAGEFERLMKKIPMKYWSFSPREYRGATPLHWAALHGQKEMVSFIRKRMGHGTREEIIDARDEYGFTPLHLAMYSTKMDTVRSIKDSEMIEDLLKMGATNCATSSLSDFVIGTDCLSNPLYPIHLAIWYAHRPIVEKLLEQWPDNAFVKTKCGDSTLHLASWCANMSADGGDIMSLLLKYLDRSPDAINSLNHDRQSPLHIAVLNQNLKCVEALLRCQQIRVSERNWRGYTPLEIATVKLQRSKPLRTSSSLCENEDDYDEYHGYKMQAGDYQVFGISKFVDENDERREVPRSGMSKITTLFDGLDAEALHKERQVYVDAANAILVGAALIASASFGAWLQPPLGYVPYYSSKFLVTDVGAPDGTYQSFVAIKQYWIIHLFWIFNSLSFFFSLATVIAGADAAVPRQGLILKEAVHSVRNGVKWASWLLSLAIVFVIGTFTTIGFAILPPIEKYRINMYFTLLIGLSLCGFVLLKLFRKLDNKSLGTINVPVFGKTFSFHI